MPEKITMTFHPIESKPEPVKPRRLSEFKPLDRVAHAGGVWTVIRGQHGNLVLLDIWGNTIVESERDHAVWYLESDWIDGRPREIPAEVTRKKVHDMKVGDVFKTSMGRMYIARHGAEQTWAVYLDRIDCPQSFSRHYDIEHEVLGHVTFESAK